MKISSLVPGLHQTKPRLAPRQAALWPRVDATHKVNSHAKYLENCAIPLGLKLTSTQIFMFKCRINFLWESEAVCATFETEQWESLFCDPGKGGGSILINQHQLFLPKGTCLVMLDEQASSPFLPAMGRGAHLWPSAPCGARGSVLSVHGHKRPLHRHPAWGIHKQKETNGRNNVFI